MQEEQLKEEQDAARNRFSPIHNNQIEKLKLEAARRNSTNEEAALDTESANQAARKCSTGAKARKRNVSSSESPCKADPYEEERVNREHLLAKN